MALNPILKLFKDFRNHFILTFERDFFASQQELFHFVNLLDFVDEHVLGDLGQLSHVLPLRNQVVGFFVDKEASTVEIFCGDLHQSLLKIELLFEIGF